LAFAADTGMTYPTRDPTTATIAGMGVRVDTSEPRATGVPLAAADGEIFGARHAIRSAERTALSRMTR
jgi:hypothetical protein